MPPSTKEMPLAKTTCCQVLVKHPYKSRAPPIIFKMASTILHPFSIMSRQMASLTVICATNTHGIDWFNIVAHSSHKIIDNDWNCQLMLKIISIMRMGNRNRVNCPWLLWRHNGRQENTLIKSDGCNKYGNVKWQIIWEAGKICYFFHSSWRKTLQRW